MNNPFSGFGAGGGLEGSGGFMHHGTTGANTPMPGMMSGRAHSILHGARLGSSDIAVPFSPQLAAHAEAAVENARKGEGARVFSPGMSTPRTSPSEYFTCICV